MLAVWRSAPKGLSEFLRAVLPHLNERQRRVVAGATAQLLGNKTVVAEAAGMSRNGHKGRGRGRGGDGARAAPASAGSGPEADNRDAAWDIGGPGPPRPPDTRGDPTSLLRWTSKSTSKLAEELVRQGYRVSADSVGRLLKRLGYSLQAPSKQKEGTRHPDRDGQFRYLDKMAETFLADGQPAISVDTKKKELVGESPTAGASGTQGASQPK